MYICYRFSHKVTLRREPWVSAEPMEKVGWWEFRQKKMTKCPLPCPAWWLLKKTRHPPHAKDPGCCKPSQQTPSQGFYLLLLLWAHVLLFICSEECYASGQQGDFYWKQTPEEKPILFSKPSLATWDKYQQELQLEWFGAKPPGTLPTPTPTPPAGQWNNGYRTWMSRMTRKCNKVFKKEKLHYCPMDIQIKFSL